MFNGGKRAGLRLKAGGAGAKRVGMVSTEGRTFQGRSFACISRDRNMIAAAPPSSA